MTAGCGDCKMKAEMLSVAHDTISKIAARAEAVELQVHELCGPYSTVALAKKRFETMAAELEEKDRLYDDLKKEFDALLSAVQHERKNGDGIFRTTLAAMERAEAFVLKRAEAFVLKRNDEVKPPPLDGARKCGLCVGGFHAECTGGERDLTEGKSYSCTCGCGTTKASH